jgi:putative ATP-dependent endonuclease of OLD family
LEALLIDPSDERTGTRLRTLAVRLGIEQKEFTVIKATAGVNLRDLILAAALGKVPADKESEKALYKSHAQTWFKTQEGGRELAGKMFGLGVWPTLSVQLMQFCNAIRAAVDLPPLQDLAP